MSSDESSGEFSAEMDDDEGQLSTEGAEPEVIGRKAAEEEAGDAES